MNGGQAAFDPQAWLAAFTRIGGGYALASGRKLWLVVDHCDHVDLTAVMAQIVGRAERIEALRRAIERRSLGQVA